MTNHQSTPDYHFEYLPNVSKIVFMTKLHPESPRQHQLVVDSLSKQILVEKVQDGLADGVKCLPGKPSWSSVSLDFLPDALDACTAKPVMRIDDNLLTLQFACTLPASIIPSHSNMDAALLKTSTGVSCASCGAGLMRVPCSLFVWKDLPNDHWLELLDCWSCHDNEFAAVAEQALSHRLRGKVANNHVPQYLHML